MILISQSLIKAVKAKTCPRAIEFEYVKGLRTEPSEVMNRGNYFEHHVLGATRDGTKPELKKIRGGALSKPEKDLINLIISTRLLMNRMGITVLDSQPELIASGMVAHLDAYIEWEDRDAILDLKYTETAEDDKWNGWGAPDMLDHTQAMHYIKLHHEITGDWLPFYYLIIGKSGWVKWLKIVATLEGMVAHERAIAFTRKWVMKQERDGWIPTPEFNRCNSCDFKGMCDRVATIPTLREIRI